MSEIPHKEEGALPDGYSAVDVPESTLARTEKIFREDGWVCVISYDSNDAWKVDDDTRKLHTAGFDFYVEDNLSRKRDVWVKKRKVI